MELLETVEFRDRGDHIFQRPALESVELHGIGDLVFRVDLRGFFGAQDVDFRHRRSRLCLVDGGDPIFGGSSVDQFGGNRGIFGKNLCGGEAAAVILGTGLLWVRGEGEKTAKTRRILRIKA